jgi:putative AlgH/UPF0301 family transcriptional regulator
MSELDRLEKLKLNSIENPGKQKRGCKSCKKPKEVIVEKLPLPFELEPYIPSVEDIKKAYIMLGGPKEEEKPFIKQVYEAIFNEEFDFNCRSCVHTQTRILKNYINNELKIKI